MFIACSTHHFDIETQTSKYIVFEKKSFTSKRMCDVIFISTVFTLFTINYFHHSLFLHRTN